MYLIYGFKNYKRVGIILQRRENITVVGACMYRCWQSTSHPIPSNTSACTINVHGTTDVINGPPNWNRDGQLCGRCHEGFAPSAYSYDWRCIKCLDNKHSVINSIVKYCVVAFLPLTVFFNLAGYSSH